MSPEGVGSILVETIHRTML